MSSVVPSWTAATLERPAPCPMAPGPFCFLSGRGFLLIRNGNGLRDCPLMSPAVRTQRLYFSIFAVTFSEHHQQCHFLLLVRAGGPRAPRAAKAGVAVQGRRGFPLKAAKAVQGQRGLPLKFEDPRLAAWWRQKAGGTAPPWTPTNKKVCASECAV